RGVYDRAAASKLAVEDRYRIRTGSIFPLCHQQCRQLNCSADLSSSDRTSYRRSDTKLDMARRIWRAGGDGTRRFRFGVETRAASNCRGALRAPWAVTDRPHSTNTSVLVGGGLRGIGAYDGRHKPYPSEPRISTVSLDHPAGGVSDHFHGGVRTADSHFTYAHFPRRTDRSAAAVSLCRGDARR